MMFQSNLKTCFFSFVIFFLIFLDYNDYITSNLLIMLTLKLAIIMQKEFGTWNFVKCLKRNSFLKIVPKFKKELRSNSNSSKRNLFQEFVPFGTNSCPALGVKKLL